MMVLMLELFMQQRNGLKGDLKSKLNSLISNITQSGRSPASPSYCSSTMREPYVTISMLSSCKTRIAKNERDWILDHVVTKINGLTTHDILHIQPEQETQIIRAIQHELTQINDKTRNRGATYSIINTKVDNFLRVSVKDALKKRAEEIINIYIFERIHHHQLSAFKKNIEWPLLKKTLKDKIKNDLKKIQAQSNTLISYDKIKMIILRAIESSQSYFLSEKGSKFKSYKKTLNHRTDETLIKTENGTTYELLNKLTEKQSYELYNQFNIKKLGKTVLKKSGDTTIRLARNIDTGNIVTVKKFNNVAQAKHEEKFYKNNMNQKNIIKIEGFAHIKQNIDKDDSIDKAYLFLEFIGFKTCDTVIKDTRMLAKYNKLAAHQRIKRYAQLYLQAVSDLHAHGIYHGNITPNNIIHTSDDEIKLDHFPLSLYQEHYYSTSSATEYSPPEALLNHSNYQYSAEKHDAFSLGLCLLELKCGVKTTSNNYLNLTINNKTYPLEMSLFKKEIGKYCNGIEQTKDVVGNTLDEVIAKLIDTNPDDRISPAEALTLPYFSSNRLIEPISHWERSKRLNKIINTHSKKTIKNARNTNNLSKILHSLITSNQLAGHILSLVDTLKFKHSLNSDNYTHMCDALSSLSQCTFKHNESVASMILNAREFRAPKLSESFQKTVELDSQHILTISFNLHTQNRKQSIIFSVSKSTDNQGHSKDALSNKPLSTTLEEYSHPSTSTLLIDQPGDDTLCDTLDKIHASSPISSGFSTSDGRLLYETSLKLVNAVIERHDSQKKETGHQHNEIDLQRFSIRENHVSLMQSTPSSTITTNTPDEYFEASIFHADYAPIKHDAFSLGLALIELKHGYPAYTIPDFQLQINGKPVNFDFIKTILKHRNKKHEKIFICKGLTDTKHLQGHTLDEVIAKLLERDPNIRITPKEAVALPYFSKNNTSSNALSTCQKLLEKGREESLANTQTTNGIREDESINDLQRSHLANYLNAHSVDQLMALGCETINKLIVLLTHEWQRPTSLHTFNFHKNTTLALEQAHTVDDIMRRDVLPETLYDKLALAHRLHELSNASSSDSSSSVTHSIKSSILRTAREIKTHLSGLHDHASHHSASAIERALLQLFHKNALMSPSDLKASLVTIINQCSDQFQLDSHLRDALIGIADKATHDYQPTELFTQQIINEAGRRFESKLALSLVNRPPSKAMKIMMKKVMIMMRSFDSQDSLLNKWCYSDEYVYLIASSEYHKNMSIREISQWRKDQLLRCNNIALFYDFHHFLTKKCLTKKFSDDLNLVLDNTYHNVIQKNRGKRILLNHRHTTNKGGIDFGSNHYCYDPHSLRIDWSRPIKKYTTRNFSKNSALHDIPLGSGISGRANIHLFGQHFLEHQAKSKGLRGMPPLTADESMLFIAGLWATLCADGGHSLIEVLHSADLIVHEGMKYLNSKKMYFSDKQIDNDFFSHLKKKQHQGALSTHDQHHGFYARVPDPMFQKLYYECWHQLCMDHEHLEV